jgi:hypothetical protein
VGLKKDATRETKEEAPPPAAGASSEPADQGSVAKLGTAPTSGEAPAPVATSPGTLPAAEKPEDRPQNAADAMPEIALQKSATSEAAPQSAERARAAAESQAPTAGSASPGAMGATGVTGESGFPRLASRHGLPLLYDPSAVSSDALLGAEADLRVLYQTGRAGEDSARVRLYLAEAARARAGDSPDTETFDTIVHHYQRAVRLARDPETAKMAMKRLQDFVSTHAPPR